MFKSTVKLRGQSFLIYGVFWEACFFVYFTEFDSREITGNEEERHGE